MGQEASLPQANGDEFEEQARAPPSSVNPPATTQGRPGSKMIGAMLHRAGHNNNNNNNNNQHQHQQQQHQAFEGKESARAAAGAGQMPFVVANQQPSHYGNGGHPPQQQQQQPVHPHQQPQSQPQAPYPPPNLQQMTPEQQQQYYQQQQVLMMQQQQQQQQQNQQYYDPHHQGAANVNAASMYGTTAVGKKGGRGKALINSMRNLSLGNSIRSGVQGAAHAAAATANAAVATATSATAAAKQPRPGGVQEWETRWDEDDDDSDGEEEEDEMDDHTGADTAAAAAAAGDVSPMHHPQAPMRPGMDAGHSSMTPRGAEMSSSSKSPPRKNVVTPIQEETDLQGMDDGLEWDTGAQQKDMAQKPNVQMFLPLLRVLGKGSFGKVVLVQKRVGKERGSLFAMKILKKTHLVKRRQIERTRTERKVLSAVNHPFIMKLHYAFQTPEKLYLVLDYCPGGELFFHLSRFRRFPERVARFYAAELLLAIGHLHKRGIIYRDLKPENVLLDAEGHVKLGDFGLAKAGLKHPCEGAISMCGTPEYMAPEVLSQQGHGFCVDYWGLGMLAYEMMTGLPPWYTTDRSKLFRRLKSAPLEIPNYFSPQSASCISALLERNPRRRLGVTGVRTAMEHEFFRSINWRALYGRRVEAPIRPCEGWKPPEAVKDDDMHCMDNGNEVYDPSMTAAGSEDIGAGDLDAATANFDNTFTRMPVHTDDNAEQADDSEAAEELNEETFVGFTFDDKDREALASGRPRTQYYHQSHNTDQQTRHQID